jgi:hypothetical protein
MTWLVSHQAAVQPSCTLHAWGYPLSIVLQHAFVSFMSALQLYSCESSPQTYCIPSGLEPTTLRAGGDARPVFLTAFRAKHCARSFERDVDPRKVNSPACAMQHIQSLFRILALMSLYYTFCPINSVIRTAIPLLPLTTDAYASSLAMPNGTLGVKSFIKPSLAFPPDLFPRGNIVLF